MPHIKARTVPHNPEDEHLLRRLAKAVAVHWDMLPESVRFAILEQAVYMHDDHETVQLKQQLERLIEEHRHIGKS